MADLTPIGGYFELELPTGAHKGYHSDVHYLNSGRNCLKLIVRDFAPTRIYLPRYTCDVLREAFDSTGVELQYYSIGPDFMPDLGKNFELRSTDLLLYTNYFGINAENVESLVHAYSSNLIVDNAHSFFSKPLGNLATFYSVRKFFGVPDGGILAYRLKGDYAFSRDVSIERAAHLLKRIEYDPMVGYDDYRRSEDALVGKDVQLISKLSARIIAGIDYESVMRRRTENYSLLHSALADKNLLQSLPNFPPGPICYPLLVDDGMRLRDYLITNRIFVPKFWPSLLVEDQLNEFERSLRNDLVCLPLDQRYGERHMRVIIDKVLDFGKLG